MANVEQLPRETHVSLSHASVDVNNGMMIRATQSQHDGAIRIRVLNPVSPFNPHEYHTEAQYEISPGDFVMMLNWYRWQKANGNDSLNFE